jgi:hypothetical protein
LAERDRALLFHTRIDEIEKYLELSYQSQKESIAEAVELPLANNLPRESLLHALSRLGNAHRPAITTAARYIDPRSSEKWPLADNASCMAARVRRISDLAGQPNRLDPNDHPETRLAKASVDWKVAGGGSSNLILADELDGSVSAVGRLRSAPDLSQL